MTIGQQELAKMFLTVAEKFREGSSRLSEIDSRFGDGDHGVTIGKIAQIMEKEARVWKDASLHDFVEKLGESIMGVNGGSAGPLYGTLIGGMADALEGKSQIDAATLREMFQASLASMRDLTKAQVGDKTMMDALIPAVEAARQEVGDIPAVLAAAAGAAAQGATESESYVAKYGRAKSYKEQTVGTPDAGAVSTAMLFAALAEGYSWK